MIAVIADDFTGAAEIAGLGWRHGLRADLLFRNEPPTDADLVVYDADSRNCSPAEARRRVTRILRRLRRHKPDWIFKKVDSVLRGNVTAEIEAALAVLRVKRCLLVSANPNAGRIIRGGRYYIQGTPLHRTDFRNDPRHPRRSSRVVDLLGRPKSATLAVLSAGTPTLHDGINAGEVELFKDVQHWAQLADKETLVVGGADFFRALLLRHGHRSGVSNRLRRSRRAARTLFVCGSLAKSSRQFLAGCRAKGWPVSLMPEEMLAGRYDPKARISWAQQIIQAMKQHRNVVVGIGRPLLSGKRTPLRLGKRLTNTVQRVISVEPPGRLCVEGGATAALLLEKMGWLRMRVEVEYATGVTGARPHRCPQLLFACKPGSYAWPAALTG